jgi:hypothetical protein
MACECLGSSASAAIELSTRGIRFGKLSYSRPFDILDHEMLDNIDPHLDWKTNRCTDWYNMLEHYTKLQLTYPSDIFPALSGLATGLQAEELGRYLAGLWEDDLGWGLCWNVKQARTKRLETYRAPTWSWASVLGQVQWPKTEIFRQLFLQSTFKLVDAEIT